MATVKQETILAAHLIGGATTHEYEGRLVINVEDSHLDSVEATEELRKGGYLTACGLFAEPINSALIGVYRI